MKSIRLLFSKIRKSQQSEQTLKTIFNNVDKEEVINYAFQYIKNYKDYDDLVSWVFPSRSTRLRDVDFLSEVFDEIGRATKVDYGKNTSQYIFDISKYSSIPFGFCEFTTISNVTTNLEITDSFLEFSKFDNEPLPLEFIINTPISKGCLKHDEVDIVAHALLQIVYIKDVNIEDSKS